MDEEIKPQEQMRRTFLRLMGASGLAIVGGRLVTQDPVSNPVMLLQSEPADPVPDHRRGPN